MTTSARKRSRRSRRRPEPFLSSGIASYESRGVLQREFDLVDPCRTSSTSDNPGTLRHGQKALRNPSFSVDKLNDPTDIADDCSAENTSPGRNSAAPKTRPIQPATTNSSEHCGQCTDSEDEEESFPNSFPALLEDHDPSVQNTSYEIFEENIERNANEEDDGYDPAVFLNPFRAAQSEDDPETEVLMSKIVSSMKKFMRRPVFLGIISLYGKCRYTLENYDHLALMMRDGDREASMILPCASTMRKFVFPRLLSKHFVESNIKSFTTKPEFSLQFRRPTKMSKRLTEAVVVLPSSWARTDVRCLHILREVACLGSCRCHRLHGCPDLRVDSTNHVVRRNEYSRYPDLLWVNKDGVPIPASNGMTVKFHTCDGETVSGLSQSVTDLKYEQVKFRGESCTSFTAKIVSTHNVRCSSDKRVNLETGEAAAQSNSNLEQLHSQCLQFLTDLCQRTHNEPGAHCDTQASASSGAEAARTRRQRHKRMRSCDVQSEGGHNYIIPSDHLTIVSFGSTHTLGVLVSRFWVRRLDEERNFFLFFNSNRRGESSYSSISTLGAANLVKDDDDDAEGSRSEPQPHCLTTGRLPSGMRYYMYRMLLYADDFNPRSTLFPRGSVGGLYMSPSSLHIRSRRSQSSIRTVSLTPAGVSTNAVLHFLLDDLVNGSIDGIECIDAFGDRVKVYFDIMGFLGDYPASSGVVDLKGHTATAPCTVCGFTFNKSEGVSTYAYTTSITCCNSSYRRTQERSSSIRNAGMTEHEQICLGMRADESLQSYACPLLKFASRHNLKLSDHDTFPPFRAVKKDGYGLNVIAPDHLISGLFKGILTMTFIQLEDDVARDKLQICLTSALSDYGFQTQTVLFKKKKKKLVPGLSMSILYCLLTVLPSILESLCIFDFHPAKQLIQNLHRFFSLAFWWPSVIIDGSTAWNFVHGARMDSYHRSLKILAANLVKSASRFIKSYPHLASHIDRPNMHRILELAYHSVPLFNHITYFCELVFESSHQPLKFYLSRNHTTNSHVYAVQLVLAKDWMVRIWCLWRIYRDDSEIPEHRRCALIGIIRLLGGKEIDEVDWSSSTSSTYLDELREHVHALMIGTVEKRFDSWYSGAEMTYNSESSWILHLPPREHTFPPEQGSFLLCTKVHLAGLCLEQPENIKLCFKALLNRGFGSAGKGAHERLFIGDIVQVLISSKCTDRGKFISTSQSEDSTPYFFVVGGFFQSLSGRSWALVKECKAVSPARISQMPDFSQPPLLEVICPTFYTDFEQSHHHFLNLNSAVSKVGVIHNCGAHGKCKFSIPEGQVLHSSDTLSGGNFFLLTRCMAFPPRRS